MSLRDLFQQNPSLKSLDRLLVGFEEHFDKIVESCAELGASLQNYPPSNIIRVDDTHYRIDVAVAGFGQDELDLELKGGRLTISGKPSPESDLPDEAFLYRGIARRGFTRTFVLNDRVAVESAKLTHGLLSVALSYQRPPEHEATKVPVTVE